MPRGSHTNALPGIPLAFLYVINAYLALGHIKQPHCCSIFICIPAFYGSWTKLVVVCLEFLLPACIPFGKVHFIVSKTSKISGNIDDKSLDRILEEVCICCNLFCKVCIHLTGRLKVCNGWYKVPNFVPDEPGNIKCPGILVPLIDKPLFNHGRNKPEFVCKFYKLVCNITTILDDVFCRMIFPFQVFPTFNFRERDVRCIYSMLLTHCHSRIIMCNTSHMSIIRTAAVCFAQILNLGYRRPHFAGLWVNIIVLVWL